MSAQRGELSQTSVLGAIAGLILLIAFVTPIVRVVDDGRDEAASMMSAYREELVQIELGLQAEPGRAELPEALFFTSGLVDIRARVDAFERSPSPANGLLLLVETKRVLRAAAIAEPERVVELHRVSAVVDALCLVLVLLPLIAGLQVVRGVLTNFRRAGTLGLALALVAGLVYFGLGAFPLVDAPAAARARAGLGSWGLAIGGGLLLVVGVFGVRRDNWWRVYGLAIAGVVAATVALALHVDGAW